MAVAVGHDFLNISANVFGIGDKKGTIIDSGTTLAYLPQREKGGEGMFRNWKLCSELEEQLVEDKVKEIALSEEAIQVMKAIQEDEQKELTIARVSEENKLNNVVEADIKRNQAMLSQKLEIDFHLMKDDKRRLEEELSHIKRSGDSSRLLFEGTSRTRAFDVDIFMDAMPLESLTLQDSSTNESFKSRKCVACSKSEVLFLPCAHQVTCVNCNKKSDFAGMCLYCKVLIEERICIYGSST
ncbi:hypothetical protein LguiA_007553 [Lonicera macranthoides]